MGRAVRSQRGLLGLDFGGNYHLDSSASRVLRHLGQRSLRSKLSALLILTVLCVFFLSRHPQPTIDSQLYSDHPSQPRSPLPDNHDIPPPARTTPTPDRDGNVPVTKDKGNPSFHLLIRQSPDRPDRTPQLCRTLYTSMVLDYPPPTLIMGERGNSSISAINKYLSSNDKLKDDDVLLIVDGSDVWFQLPPDLLIQRFYSILREKNRRLRWRYGKHLGSSSEEGSGQVYSARILFGADKECHAESPYEPACAAVPHSPLMPDIYGPETDDSENIANYRPRWLNSGTVMGLMGDMRLLYNHAAKMATKQKRADEQQILSRIYGEQEYVREMYRLTSARSWVTRLVEALGIFDTVDLSNVTLPVVQGRRYDFGIGLDYESELFFTMFHTENDAVWLEYDDVPTLSEIQRRHGVPREHRLLLPDDITELPSPFTQTRYNRSDPSALPFLSIDRLPPPRNVSWHNIRLATNVRSTAVPPVIHLNSTAYEHTGGWWASMWFHPWARALLRKYIRSTQEPDAVASSLQGGSDAWDMRGGRGGVWTGNHEWKGWAEMCKGFEDMVFRDQLGPWGHEGGEGHEDPVYNQWGVLVSGDPSG